MVHSKSEEWARIRVLVAGARLNRERYSSKRIRRTRAEYKRIHCNKKGSTKKASLLKHRKPWIGTICSGFMQLSIVQGKTALVPAMCNDREGCLLTVKTLVAAMCQEHFEYLLNDNNEDVPRNRMFLTGEKWNQQHWMWLRKHGMTRLMDRTRSQCTIYWPVPCSKN